jgi:transposase
MAVVQLRNPTEGRAYCDAKKAATTSMEAMRALKRRLSNVVYTQISPTRNEQWRRAREGTRGRLCNPA